MQEQKNWNQFKASLSDLMDARGNGEQAKRIQRNRDARARRDIVREMCGTSYAAAKLDGSI